MPNIHSANIPLAVLATALSWSLLLSLGREASHWYTLVGGNVPNVHIYSLRLKLRDKTSCEEEQNLVLDSLAPLCLLVSYNPWKCDVFSVPNICFLHQVSKPNGQWCANKCLTTGIWGE